MTIPANINDRELQKFDDINNLPTVRTTMYGSGGNQITVNDSGQLKVVLDGKICSNNTSVTPLLAGGKFEGVAGETLDYALVFVNVYSDKPSATNGLKYYTSLDGILWIPEDSFTVPANTGKTFSFQPNNRYFKVEYTNGAEDQTTFMLATVFKKTNSKASSHKINDSIIGEDDAELVKSVMTGENPAGTFVNFQATTQGNFKVSLEELENSISVNSNSQLRTTQFDSQGNELGLESQPLIVSYPDSHFDAFRRFTVAAPFKLIEYSASYPLDFTRYHSKSEVGGGTVARNATTTQIELQTTTASGDKAIFQTRRNVQYNKGNAQEIFIIYRPNPTTNRRERWGYFDANNGVFFEHDGTDPRLVIRSSTSGTPVDTQIERANWDDPLDGTGTSGLTIDFTKQTVFKIDFGWLSSRGVRFFADVGGTFVLIKTWFISNTLTFPFMATPTLPVRFEVENTGTTSGTAKSSFSCFAVQSSGSNVQEGALRSLNNDVTPTSISATEAFIFGVRLNSSFLNASLQPINASFLPASGTDYAFFKVIYNPTLVGDTWAAGESGVFDYLTALTSYSGGSVISSGHFSLGNKNTVGAPLARDILTDIYVGRGVDNAQDPLIVIMRTSSGSGSVYYDALVKEYL